MCDRRHSRRRRRQRPAGARHRKLAGRRCIGDAVVAVDNIVATVYAIAERARLDAPALHVAEKTSTTKRKRRVGWFEWDQFRNACALNAPTDIVLTFADYLGAENKNARRFEQLNPDTIKFVEELERVSQAPVSLINTRFSREAGASADLRSLIDRRNWTAQTRPR